MSEHAITDVSHETFHVQHKKSGNIGRMGEEIACRYYIGKNHTILSRNQRIRNLESDIVTRFHGKQILIEVKTVAREIIGINDISREILGASGRYTGKKERNMTIIAKTNGFDEMYLLCVLISLGDKRAYTREIRLI